MSTYTDLHNNIKETINVDYNRRTTNQQVKLLNEQNEYWGTFKGQMEVQGNSVISGAQLQDVVINNAVLCGDIDFGGTGIPIDEITNTLKQISVNYQSKDEELDGKITKNTDNITQLNKRLDEIKDAASGDTEKLEENLTKKISDTSVAILLSVANVSAFLSVENANIVSSLDLSVANLISAIEVEATTRKNDDDSLRLSITENANTIASNYNTLTKADDVLSNLALNVDKQSKERDEEIIAKIDAYADEVNEKFVLADSKMLSTVDENRHYEIIKSSSIVTNEYPFLLTDYAVNIISTTVEQLLLQCNGTNVGSVVKTADEKITIHFFKTLPDYLAVAVKAGQNYDFNKNKYTKVSNGYKVWYADDTIKFEHDNDPFFKIEYNNSYVGKVTHAHYNTDGQLLSGEIELDPEDSQFDVFMQGFNGKTISKDNKLLSYQDATIQLNDDLKSFTFRKGIIDAYYSIAYIASDDGDKKEFAKIFKNTLSDDADKNVIKFTATLSDDIEVTLTKENDMSADFTDAHGKKMRLQYDAELSALKQYDLNEKFSYDLKSASASTQPAFAKIVINDANAEYSHSYRGNIVYTVVNSDIEQLNAISVECSYDATRNIWSGVNDAIDNISISVSIFPGTDKVTVNGIAYGAQFNAQYEVDVESKKLDNIDTQYNSVLTTYAFDIHDTSLFIERGTKYNCIAYKAATPEQSYRDFECNIKSSGSQDVKIAVPVQKYLDKSREMIVNMTIESSMVDVKVVFSDESKQNISVMCNGKNVTDNYIIKPNTQNIFKLREYESGKFLLEQLDNADLLATMSAMQYDIADNHTSAVVLRRDVDAINEQLSSTLRYQGMISVDNSITSFAELLFNFYDDGDVKANDTRNKPVYPGYFWIVNAISNDYKIEDVKVGKNDRIYINGRDPIAISAVTSARVDVEDVYDSDTIHESQLCGISIILSNYTSDVSNALCEASCVLSTDDMFLSSQISGKVGIGTYDAKLGAYDISYTDLSIVTISDDAYYSLKNDGKLLSNITYVISSDRVNAHDERVINVAGPSVDTDAANKKYVDDISVEQDSKLADINKKLTNNTTGIAYLASVSAVNASFNERYDSVLSTVEVCHHKADGECDMLSVEQLIVTDEDVLSATGTKDQYHLTFKYGTLVLVKN